MERNCSNNEEWELKSKAVSSDDVERKTPCPNNGTIIFKKRKGSENKDLKGKEMEDGSSSDSHKKESDLSPVAVPNLGVENVPEPASSAKVLSLPQVAYQSPLVLKPAQDYPCRYCPRRFRSPQGFGGHQNSHKNERANVKRRRRTRYSSSLVVYPQLPLGQADNFALARTSSYEHPYSSTPISPNTKYPQSNVWFNKTQLSAYNRSSMIGGYPRNNYDNQTSCGLNIVQATMLEEFATLNGNARSNFNSLRMEHNEGGSQAEAFRTVNGNSRFAVAGLIVGGISSTASSEARSFLELSQGEGSVRYEIHDTIKGYDKSDGTIDLLSRVGMSSTEAFFTVNGKSRFAVAGFIAGGTGSGARSFLELSQGEGNVRYEIHDTIKGYDMSDGAIDLLSQVGMGSTKDA